MAMTKQKNSERLEAAKTSVRNALEEHKQDVRRNNIKYFGMGVFAHLDFLVKCVDQLTGGDPKKLDALAINAIDTVEDASVTSAAA